MILPGLDLYYADPAQHLVTAGGDLDVDRDLSGMWKLRILVPWGFKREKFPKTPRADHRFPFHDLHLS